MKIVVASNNKHKIAEIKAILKDVFESVLTLEDMGIDCDPEENGNTFIENALIKVNAISKFTDLPVLADDTGLCVKALNGAPGVHSARYAGNHDHTANRKKLLDELKDKQNRDAYFETVVALKYPDGRLLVASGRVDGSITTEEHGECGFGYDTLFYSTELGKTFGEATEEEKNSVSHRARALKNLLQQLQ